MASERIQKIVKSLDKKVRKLLKPDHFYVVLYDTVKSELVFLRVLSEKEDVDEKTRSYQPQRLPDQIIEKKKHWLVEENIDEQFEAAGVVYGPGDQQPGSWLGMPMIFEGRVLGALVVESRVSRAFGKRGVRVLSTMARQTASAIENSRLYERMEAINEIGQKLNSQIQLKESEILTLIHEEASKLIYADNMYIALYDESLDEIRFPIIYVGGEKIKVPARKLDRDKMGKTEYIILNEESLFHATRAESKAWYDQPGHADHIDNPLASWIGVPMVVRDKVVGVIAAYHQDQDYVYDKHDLLILESMANQAAIALDNASLVRGLENAQSKIAETEFVLTRASIASDFVHRMNNLAGTIPIWVDFIRRRFLEQSINDNELDQYLDNIEEEAGNLLRGAEKLEESPKTEKIDVQEILEKLVRQANVQMPANIESEFICGESLLKVSAVRLDLSNVFWNIIENGIEAMPEGGCITIEVKMKENRKWVETSISDEGRGILESKFRDIFAPFFSTKPGHMGYGLWRAKNIVEKIGGSINFTTQKNEGTTFFVRLPAGEEE